MTLNTKLCISTLLLLTAALGGCDQQKEKINGSRFTLVSARHSNIDFSNDLKEDEDFNIIEYLYFYNGGGVAVGDINNDGLPDIYFSGNQVPNRLYLNKGNLTFEDITSQAGVAAGGNWKTGVAMADVNGDGLLDIFSCGVGGYKKFAGRNQLFINNGDLSFTERTKEYGLAFQGFSTQVAFLDYDNDGDLDMYLLNHSVHTVRSHGDILSRFQSHPKAGDKLYQNQLVPSGVVGFTEVTSAAGILNSQIAYGLGVGVSDVNNDGYPDLYVSNDFHENDYLYINQKNGKFLQTVEKSLGHCSRFSMGNDLADINNDDRTDIITLDMLPSDEGIIKTSAGEDPYDIFQFKLRFGFHYQFSRNCLQLNRGLDRDQNVIFWDIAGYSGIQATDWSWAPLMADFDNDGFKDIFIANGISKRPNDLDYINFISGDSAQKFLSDKELSDRMPSGKVSNFMFRNKHNLTFEDVSASWFGTETTLSNGSAYADLDNDGDLDLVLNNCNAEAMIYRNDLPKSNHFLQIKLKGPGGNTSGIGTKIHVFTNAGNYYYEQFPVRGWQSSVDHVLTIGVGPAASVDSVRVIWPGSSFEVKNNLKSDALVTFNFDEAKGRWNFESLPNLEPWSFVQDTSFKYRHKENYFTPFTDEKLIPVSLATQGPKISVGDIDGDKQPDVFIGGAKDQPGILFTADRKGELHKLKPQKAILADSSFEDTANEFLDANGDGSLDLLVASGGQQFQTPEKTMLRLYTNDGKGTMKRDNDFPKISVNASCVRSSDIDADGDIDIFVGGRVVPGSYGSTPRSYILVNGGKGLFTDKSAELLPEGLGMVSDALWVDLNHDRRKDLVVVGEWMPVTVLLQNANGKFDDATRSFGLDQTEGWWNCITSADFDHDGDEDLVAGNFGLNSRFAPTASEPVDIFIGDIDSNGSQEQIMTYYNHGIQHPFITRDLLIKQIPPLKKKFLKYSDFKVAQLTDIIPPEKLPGFVHRTANTFASVYLENVGTGFIVSNLPVEMQLFSVFSLLSDDFNGDGHPDIMAVGNIFQIQPELGRNDAGKGVILLGDGRGKFKSVPSEKSGFYVPGEGRDIKRFVTSAGRKIFLVARNNDSLLVFKQPIK
jgi:enediyne biosynthesis protein E4